MDLRAVVESIEWVTSDLIDQCPECKGYRPGSIPDGQQRIRIAEDGITIESGSGHLSDCIIGKALERPECGAT